MRAGQLSSEVPQPAPDRIALPQVTLIAATSIALEATLSALRKSMQHLSFAKVILFSDHVPEGADLSGITWQKIEPLKSRWDYSRFMLRQLHDYVETSHVLCVQWDGYVLDPNGWCNSFLEHDYIGAPWPQFDDAYTVGNGGFSLRSRRLLEACTKLNAENEEAEDVTICRIWRPMLEEQFGLNFAPDSKAREFSFERHARQGDEFGFHGAFNLVKILIDTEMRRLLSTLELQVLTKREHRELFSWAMLHGRWRLAWMIYSRIWCR
jgi:Protein of unknown function (DUF5672)